MPLIEVIDQEMIDQTAIESPSNPLDGSTHTSVNHIQILPEQGPVIKYNVQSPMEDVSIDLEMAGCAAPTPGPTIEIHGSASQYIQGRLIQGRLPQCIQSDRSLLEMQEALTVGTGVPSAICDNYGNIIQPVSVLTCCPCQVLTIA